MDAPSASDFLLPYPMHNSCRFFYLVERQDTSRKKQKRGEGGVP